MTAEHQVCVVVKPFRLSMDAMKVPLNEKNAQKINRNTKKETKLKNITK